MELQIKARHAAVGEALRAHAAVRLRQAVIGLSVAPIRAEVEFTDLYGPKGGLDKGCEITVHLPRAAPVRVEEIATAHRTALDTAVARLRRLLTRYREIKVIKTRYPKKYYAASRALGGERPRPRKARRS